MTMVKTGDDEFTERFKDRMDPATMKIMKELLGKEGELDGLESMKSALSLELQSWQDRYNKIEFTMRMLSHRISAIEKEQKTRAMVERGFYIEGEFNID